MNLNGQLATNLVNRRGGALLQISRFATVLCGKFALAGFQLLYLLLQFVNQIFAVAA